MNSPFQKVAAHGLIKKDRKYLLTLRSPVNDYKPNEWDIPGGSIEIGETADGALIREIKEETDLEVKIVKPVFVCSELQKSGRHQFWIVYECNYLSGEVKLNPEEHSEYKWASLEEIAKLKKIMFAEELFKTKLS
jgi:8-oxo-dGTP diphosphatase